MLPVLYSQSFCGTTLWMSRPRMPSERDLVWPLRGCNAIERYLAYIILLKRYIKLVLCVKARMASAKVKSNI